MTRRKTVALTEAVMLANRMLAGSVVPPEGREGIIALIETLLHTANNYQGFGYLEADKVPFGHLPGIIWNRNEAGELEAPHQFPDETRRFYYLPR